MPTREEMLSLADDVVRSYEDRIKVIPELRRAEAERKGAAVQEIAQRRSAEAERKRTEARGISQRRSDVSTMLKGFDDAHAAMSNELKAKLTKDEQERRRTTAQEIAQRKSDVGAMLQEFAKGDAERRSEVTGMLKEFDNAHAAMSKELRAKLATDEQERRRTTAQEISQRKSDVGSMLKGFREEQAGVRDEWQKLTATMQSKRGGVAVAVKPLIEEIAEGAAEIIPETAALREQVFEYLANRPDGTKLVELEEEFGVARIQMAKVVKILMGQNKVEKRDLLYFAV